MSCRSLYNSLSHARVPPQPAITAPCVAPASCPPMPQVEEQEAERQLRAVYRDTFNAPHLAQVCVAPDTAPASLDSCRVGVEG